MRKRVFIDLDGVLADFDGGPKSKLGSPLPYTHHTPHFFLRLDPIPGAIDAYKSLAKKYEVHILSTAPWSNPFAWKEKREWVHNHLGRSAFKKLTLTHRKDLLIGDYLIDDRTLNGADKFTGKHIWFGSNKFPNWKSVLKYLL
jgi:5'(3')-deoxyribonucleotidase